MTSLQLFHSLFAGGLLFTAIVSAMTQRLQLMIRLYAAASFCLVALTVGLATEHGSVHLLYAAAATLLLKVFLIPSLIGRMVKHVGASLRVVSSLRPTTTLFLTVAILFLVLFNMRQSAFFQAVNPSYILFISVSMVLIGFLLMTIRRDVYSEILAFLTLENGIALFSIATIGTGPALVETGIFSVILIGAVLMTLLSQRVRELYGTENTDLMRELID